VESIIRAATVLVTAAAFGQTPPAVDAVVAADGSGQYRTVQEAINAAPQETSATRRWIIAVRPGTYHELLYVQREKRFVMLVGDDPATTIVTYGLRPAIPVPTASRSARSGRRRRSSMPTISRPRT